MAARTGWLADWRLRLPPTAPQDRDEQQREGELAADLDPAHVFLALLTAGVAPVLLPHVAHGLFGDEADSPEFSKRYAQQLSRMVAHLAEPTEPSADED